MSEPGLHFREWGDAGGPPLVLLHGLLASLNNWQAVAGRLSAGRRVFAVDLPHHGRSPHLGIITYEHMADELCDLLDRLGLPVVDLLGHSLGGKLAMVLALRQPARVQRLIIEDIAPRVYPNRFQRLIEAMLAIDLEALGHRRDADRQLEAVVPDAGMRMFLLTNLAHAGGRWTWRANLRGLADAAEQLREFPVSPAPAARVYAKPAIFIHGAKSEYLGPADAELVQSHFPSAKLQAIAGAGHWVHADQPEAFCEAVSAFLDDGIYQNNK